MTADAAAEQVGPAGAPYPAATRSRARYAPAFVAGRIAAVALTLAAGITSAATAGSATASTNAGLQAEANTIASTISADDQTLASLGTRYLSEEDVYAAATHREKALLHAIAHIDRAVSKDHSALRTAAVDAYVDAGSDSDLQLFLDADDASLTSGPTYLRVASDQLSEAVTKLHDDEHTLGTALTTERRAADAATAALAATTHAHDAVLSTVSSERHLLASVRGELATLVRQEEVAEEHAAALREAAAARRAAEQAAAAAAASTTTTKPSLATGTTGTTGTTGNVTTTAAGTPDPPATASGPPAPTGVPTDTSPIPAGTIAQDLAGIRQCESSDDYTLDTGNGYYGAYQFSLATWAGLGGSGLPSAAPPGEQDARAYRLYEEGGWESWPECAAILGLH